MCFTTATGCVLLRPTQLSNSRKKSEVLSQRVSHRNFKQKNNQATGAETRNGYIWASVIEARFCQGLVAKGFAAGKENRRHKCPKSWAGWVGFLISRCKLLAGFILDSGEIYVTTNIARKGRRWSFCVLLLEVRLLLIGSAQDCAVQIWHTR